jgi:hypothetical protein
MFKNILSTKDPLNESSLIVEEPGSAGLKDSECAFTSIQYHEDFLMEGGSFDNLFENGSHSSQILKATVDWKNYTIPKGDSELDFSIQPTLISPIVRAVSTPTRTL